MHVVTMTGFFNDDTPIRWWNFRRRARRLAFLELVAKSEVRITLNGVPQLTGTLESAYNMVIGNGSADHARGLAFADVLRIGSGCVIHDEDGSSEAVISLRVPLDVQL